MELRPEIKSFVEGSKQVLSIGSKPALSREEADLILHYVSEVESLVSGDDELGMSADAA